MSRPIRGLTALSQALAVIAYAALFCPDCGELRPARPGLTLIGGHDLCAITRRVMSAYRQALRDVTIFGGAEFEIGGRRYVWTADEEWLNKHHRSNP